MLSVSLRSRWCPDFTHSSVLVDFWGRESWQLFSLEASHSVQAQFSAPLFLFHWLLWLFRTCSRIERELSSLSLQSREVSCSSSLSSRQSHSWLRGLCSTGVRFCLSANTSSLLRTEGWDTCSSPSRWRSAVSSAMASYRDSGTALCWHLVGW